jgi:hypothetical protein
MSDNRPSRPSRMNDVIAYFIMRAIIAITFQFRNIADDLHNGDGSGIRGRMPKIGDLSHG